MSGPADFHSHVIPGVDDGAASDAESAAALQAFVEQGTERLIATPHVDGSLTLRPAALAVRLAEIDAGWDRLSALARGQFPRLTIRRGAEVMLDTPEPDLSDDRLRLGGGTFVLVEFPYMSVPPRSTGVLRALAAGGVTPVIAHPERYAGMTPRSRLPAEWRGAGALLQVNAGSITGRYGTQARLNALALLEAGLADYVCSDYHARGRLPTAGARRVLVELGGAEQAELLTVTNPARLFDARKPLPVAPLRPRRTTWDRLRRWLG
jgi:protein-tyrosine phosphatase